MVEVAAAAATTAHDTWIHICSHMSSIYTLRNRPRTTACSSRPDQLGEHNQGSRPGRGTPGLASEPPVLALVGPVQPSWEALALAPAQAQVQGQAQVQAQALVLVQVVPVAVVRALGVPVRVQVQGVARASVSQERAGVVGRPVLACPLGFGCL